VESAAMGLLAGINAACFMTGRAMIPPPRETALGSLAGHLQKADPMNFQPMNITFGLFPPLPCRIRKRDRGRLYADRALTALTAWQQQINEVGDCLKPLTFS
jgi:methylenetetrahydrofolate--tRNA-(uracil-5-)-methyltransferase